MSAHAGHLMPWECCDVCGAPGRVLVLVHPSGEVRAGATALCQVCARVELEIGGWE